MRSSAASTTFDDVYSSSWMRKQAHMRAQHNYVARSLARDACAHLHTLADKSTLAHTHSNYEKVVMELREGSAAKDAEIVELQKKLEKLSS
jgi:hypothetical protein